MIFLGFRDNSDENLNLEKKLDKFDKNILKIAYILSFEFWILICGRKWSITGSQLAGSPLKKIAGLGEGRG